MLTQFFLLKNPESRPKMEMEEGVRILDEKKPWIEKYRPQVLDEVIFQKEAVETFKGIKKTGKMPHMLLYGPPGTGKTSIIIALAQELFGRNFYEERILELNASDDRGIDKVRSKIKSFAEKQLKTIPGVVPKFKIIILDEADNMTKDAQQALRRIIEDYSKITRFCIICNYVTKIIEPIKSRCIKFRFKPIPLSSQISRLKDIADYEKIHIDDKAISKLIEVSKGDMRKSVNLLQLVQSAYENSHIDVKHIVSISDVIPCEDFKKEFLTPYFKLHKEEEKINFIENLIKEGFMCNQVVFACHDWILKQKDIDSFKKAQIITLLSDIDKYISLGSRDDLNLMLFFDKISKILKN